MKRMGSPKGLATVVRTLMLAIATLSLALGGPTRLALAANERAVFEFGYDTYRFANEDKSFQKRPGETYTITGDYRDLLFKGNTASENARINSELEEEWGGSCFGMASVLSLVRGHYLEPRFFQSGARKTYDFDVPVRNESVRNMINYYQLMQFVGSIASRRGDYSKSNEAANNRNLMKALDQNRYPIVFGIDIYRHGTRTGGHALVAYDYRPATGGYEVSVWDPNHRTRKIKLFVSRDYQTSRFLDGYEWETGSYSTFIKYAIPAEGTLGTYRNLQKGLRSMGRSDGYQTSAKALASDGSDELDLNVTYDSFTIESSSGKSAQVVHGTKVMGDLPISDGDYENEPNFEFDIHFALPALAPGESYTVTPDSGSTTPAPEAVDPEVPMPETVSATYRTELLDPAEDGGFYSAIETDAVGACTFADDGTTTSDLAEGAAEQRVAVTSNAVETPWTTVEGAGTVDTLSVDPATSGNEEAAIVADAPAVLTVTASNLYNETTLTASGTDFSLAESDGGALALTADDEGLQTAPFGHSVVFYTGEEGAIATVTNVMPGERIARPADPTEPDREFLGWYLTPDGGDAYDFDAPVTGDLTLYAHWSEAPDEGIEMERLYNPYTGEHLFTADDLERDSLERESWVYEGVMWRAPRTSVSPVWRLYNPTSGDHHYARTLNEYETLQRIGWQGEGVAFHSDDAHGTPVYRLFNPYAVTGTHHYTTSIDEHDANVASGWVDEGVGWYGLAD